MIDRVTRDLFGVELVELKGVRVAGVRCVECGRRGYCVKVCRRRSLRGAGALDELELRWAYCARLVYSNNWLPLAMYSRRGAPTRRSSRMT